MVATCSLVTWLCENNEKSYFYRVLAYRLNRVFFFLFLLLYEIDNSKNAERKIHVAKEPSTWKFSGVERTEASRRFSSPARFYRVKRCLYLHMFFFSILLFFGSESVVCILRIQGIFFYYYYRIQWTVPKSSKQQLFLKFFLTKGLSSTAGISLNDVVFFWENKWTLNYIWILGYLFKIFSYFGKTRALFLFFFERNEPE